MSKAREILDNTLNKNGTWKNGICSTDVKYLCDKIIELEAEKAELIEILEPIKRIIDMYELYNELSIELIYDKLKKYIETKS